MAFTNFGIAHKSVNLNYYILVPKCNRSMAEEGDKLVSRVGPVSIIVIITHISSCTIDVKRFAYLFDKGDTCITHVLTLQ